MANSNPQPPPPPPWEGSIPYDAAGNPNEALGNELLTGDWNAEDISTIRRVANGDTYLWVYWGPKKVPVLTSKGEVPPENTG